MFDRAATAERGVMLVAHVRQRTVGDVATENTHPFLNEDWVFAHNGTIEDVGFLRGETSAARLRSVQGTTDSELLFAFVLTRLEAGGAIRGRPRPVTDMSVARAAGELAQHPALGATNFLMSDGDVLYAFRRGRPLWVLERRSHERGDAVLIASQPVTDEAWSEVPEGKLLAAWRHPRPQWKYLATAPSTT